MFLQGKKILVIEDAFSIRTFLRIALTAHGSIFDESETAERGVDICRQITPDLVVLDLGLPDKDGLEILPIIKKMNNHTKVIILSVRKEQKIKDKAFELGADAYLTKPFLMEELLELIEDTIRKR